MVGCQKESLPSDTNLTVKEYIEQLRSSTYDADTLPAFTYLDIPELLKYRDEIQIIHSFPENLLSSYLQPECRLGMYVLWTIESIRAVSVNSRFMLGRFPSLNPVLTYRVQEEFNIVDTDESHRIVAKAYYDWWESHKGVSFDEFKNTDPLLSTAYRWH
jgi:hypothetical protein